MVLIAALHPNPRSFKDLTMKTLLLVGALTLALFTGAAVKPPLLTHDNFAWAEGITPHTVR